MDYTIHNDVLTLGLKKKGGELGSIKNANGVEFLWQGNSEYWGGQAPILFPICGVLRNGQATIGDGQVTKMSRHGIVRKRDFDVTEWGEDFITFSLTSDDTMYDAYPYHFKLTTTYSLDGNSITIHHRITNLEGIVMPYFIGGHPAFNCPLYGDEGYDDYYVQFEKKEHVNAPYLDMETGLVQADKRRPVLDDNDTVRLHHDLFTTDSIVLDTLQSRKAALYSDKNGKVLEIAFPDAKYVLLWSSANGGDFIAIEPWTGLATGTDESDVFEEKHNCQFIEPGKTVTYTYTITIFK